ncbi:unnamed protein product [marine sediment metagenome]|uniref:Glycosyltransferase 2-like domain-containing protein n=1 Tax=marine sediment metagenome TaxID=412755 RepID=X1SHG0_9ZZZZ
MREQGISALFASQNSEKTIVACITSFLEFADEIIIVDNGSTDNTIILCQELAQKYKKVKFYNHPEIVHLYENRQIALEHSKFKWIFRADTDYVACDNIMELRERILKTSTKNSPIIFQLKQINLIHDIHHTKYEIPVGGLMPRFYSFAKKMQFQRLGRWEGMRYFKDVVKLRINRPVMIEVKKPYWFHCQFKEPMDYKIDLEDNIDNGWEIHIKCDFNQCYERGTYFACYIEMFRDCFYYKYREKKEEGTNCTQE